MVAEGLWQRKVWGFSQTEEGYLSQPGVILVIEGLKEDLEPMSGLLGRHGAGPGSWRVIGVRGERRRNNGASGREVSKWQELEVREKNEYL